MRHCAQIPLRKFRGSQSAEIYSVLIEIAQNVCKEKGTLDINRHVERLTYAYGLKRTHNQALLLELVSLLIHNDSHSR